MSSVPIYNVYNMLVYAFEVLQSKEYDSLGNEKCENIYDLLASLLLCGTKALIRRGFLRSYIHQTEELGVIRGKVDVCGSIRKLSLQNAKAVCTFDDFRSDICFNQTLKATFQLLKRNELKQDIRRDISKILLYFSDISDIDINHIKWNGFVFHRNNAHYDTLLYFCRLICEEAVANQNKGKKDFRTIEDALLPKLFERFIFCFYKKHLTHSVLHQRQIKWDTDNVEMMPKMSADIVIEDCTQKLIIDTKFYSKTLQGNRFTDNQTVLSNNLYQIFAYVKNEAASSNKTVSGMLLYPQVDFSVDLVRSIGGNIFYVKTVDLNVTFNAIKQQLLCLMNSTAFADDYVGQMPW